MFLFVGECLLTTKLLLFLLILLPTVSSWSGEEEGHKMESQWEKGDEKGEQKNSDATVFRVFRIFARTWEDVRALSALRAIAQENPEIDFWLDSVHPGQFADVMVSPLGMPIFRRFLRSNPSLKVQITVEDVEKLILRNEFRPRLERMARLRRRLKRGGRWIQRRSIVSPLFDQLRGAHYPFGEYTGYSAMIRYLRTLEFYYPNLVQLIQIGATHEGRSIEGVKIGHNPMTAKGKPKRAFWIDGNMHAREWASSHTALFIINQLVANYGRDPFLTNALNRVDFYIVPCANPDGFEFSRSSMNPKIRLWRKNRSPEQCTRTWSGLLCCRGVDLNRNFDFHWAETGSSLNACSNLFAGKRAFSEPEARAIANFLQADELRGRLDAFITLHTYAQMWIHPFSHEYQLYPKDVQKLKSLALRATSRLKEIYGTTYRVGTGADLLAPASGGSDDWAKEKLGVKFVYLVELRPQLDLSNGFILRQEELLPTAYETFEAIKEVIRGVLLENGLATNLATNGTLNAGGNNSSPFPSTHTTSMPSVESSTTAFLSSKTTFSTTNSNQSLSLLPTTIFMTNVGQNELTTSKTSQFASTQLTPATNTTMNSESTATFASIKQGTMAQTLNSTTQTLISKATKTMGKQKEEISEKTVDDDFIVFVPNSTSSPSINAKMTAESRHRIFTLPWVPTRRVTVTPMSTTAAENQRIQSTITMGTNPQPVSSSTKQSTISSPSPITILFTAIEPSWEETNEIDVLPTQMTPPPLLRTANKFLGSDSLHKFGVHRWERNNEGGKLVELKEVGNNLTALIRKSVENSTMKTTQTVPIISWPTRKCSDEKSSCAFWIRAHRPVCVEQRRFMQRNCAFSCGFCRIGN